ncbi:MAG: glycosyltransferase [Bacteroidetes bacterium]|nr:glycosyltransferase [Bacteroidota bacterium]
MSANGLPKVFYLGNADKGGGAEERLNRTADYYPNTLEFYVKHSRNSRPFVKKFPPHWSDSAWKLANRIYQKLSGSPSNLKVKLGLTEHYNFTWRRLKHNPKFLEADIVHIGNMHTNYLDFSALEKILQHKKVLLNVSDMWLLTGGEAYTLGDEGFMKGNARSADISVPPILNPWWDRRKQNLKRKAKIYRKFAGKLFFAANSGWTAHQIAQAWVMQHKPVMRTIVPGVDTQVFCPPQRRDWERPRVLLYNSNSIFKNTRVVLEALAQVTYPIDLYVIGAALKEEFAKDNIRVISGGSYLHDPHDLAQAMQQADIFLYPSRAEAFGTMVAEAKACGMCVIGSRTGGITEQLNNGTGVLVDPSDASGLAHAIDYWAAHLEEARRIGLLGIEDVLARYSFERYMQETVDYYTYIHYHST